MPKEVGLISALWSFFNEGGDLVVQPGVRSYPPWIKDPFDDEHRRLLALKYGADPDAIVRLHHAIGERNAARRATEGEIEGRIRNFATDRRLPPDDLVEYWRSQWSRTAAAPTSPKPPALTAGMTDFYPDELDTYNAILAKPYETLDPRDCRWILTEADAFLPVEHIRYRVPVPEVDTRRV